MYNWVQNVTPADGNMRLPVHLWEVTASKNNNVGVLTVPQVGWELRAQGNTATDNYHWYTLGNQLTTESFGHTSGTAGFYPQEQAYMDWMKVKLLFYCPLKYAVKLQVRLVKFLDEEIAPAGAAGDQADNPLFQVSGTKGKELTAEAARWWQDEIHKLVMNPVTTMDIRHGKKMITLFNDSFILNPKETTDTTSNRYHQLDVFRRMNRIINYRPEQISRYNLYAQDTTGVSFSSDNFTHPFWRSRIYLMISGMAIGHVGAQDTNTAVDKWPSYDMVLRTQLTTLA